MRPIIALPVTLALTASCATAPSTAAVAAADPTPNGDYALASIRPLYDEVKQYLLASAEQMPAEQYGYRPVAGVRSFGEILGHVASDQYWFCSRVKGEPREGDETLEHLDKEHMLVALREAFAYCDDLYASLPADRAAELVPFGRRQMPRLYLLDYNVTHDWEHYGNLITYFRMNGMTPPSSQPGGG